MAGHGFAMVGISTLLANGLIAGFRRLKSRFGGISPCCRAREAFNIPASPAVPCVWPITVLIEPT